MIEWAAGIVPGVVLTCDSELDARAIAETLQEGIYTRTDGGAWQPYTTEQAIADALIAALNGEAA